MMSKKMTATIVMTTVLLMGPPLEAAGTVPVPQFKLDTAWPKELPNHWQLGPVTGQFVDRHDHIWIISQSAALTDYDLGLQRGESDCCNPSPQVMVFDRAGNVVKSWGGPGAGYKWPAGPHTIYVDAKENVWIAGNGKVDTQVLKFNNDGKFLLQIGGGPAGGNADTANLNRAVGIAVWPATNEVFIADGYGNRRVIVFDADTGTFKRQWGAYGGKPEDAEPQRSFEGPGARQFNVVRDLAITPDGVLWVADRLGSRVQQFHLDGTFIKEGFISRQTKNPEGTIDSISFSKDPKMSYVYLADGANKKVHIVERTTLKEVGYIGGHGGQMLGAFNHIVGTTVDSSGNLYTAEAAAGARIERWNLVKNAGYWPKSATHLGN